MICEHQHFKVLKFLVEKAEDVDSMSLIDIEHKWMMSKFTRWKRRIFSIEHVLDAERDMWNYFEDSCEKWNVDDFCQELKTAENEKDVGKNIVM